MPPDPEASQQVPSAPYILKRDYFSIEAEYRIPNPVMPYFSAAVLLGLYLLSIAALLHFAIIFLVDPGGPNLLTFVMLGIGGFIVVTLIMVGFPFRPTYIILTEKELAFRDNDGGFMMFGKKVLCSLERPLELTLWPHYKLMDVKQEGEKGHQLNLNGLPLDDIFKLLGHLEQYPNVKLKRMN